MKVKARRIAFSFSTIDSFLFFFNVFSFGFWNKNENLSIKIYFKYTKTILVYFDQILDWRFQFIDSMLKNEVKNNLGTPEKKTKQKIFSSDQNTQLLSDRNYFRRQSKNDRKTMNTQPLQTKQSPFFRDRRNQVKSGFNLTRK